MSTRKKLLVTGANGFIGRQVLAQLDPGEWEIHAPLEPNLKRRRQESSGTRLTLRHNVPEELVQSVAPSHLLHLAWNVTPGQFWTAPDNIDWLRSSLALYQSFVAANGTRAVFCGSCAEYDWTVQLLDEAKTPLRPATLYGATKAALSNVLLAAASNDRTQVAWGRLFFVWAERAASPACAHVISSLLQGHPALCTNGLAERDFIARPRCRRGSDCGAEKQILRSRQHRLRSSA